ncbi:MAG: carbohydrate ABC transporter permease [Clostridiales bacterium]|jgi:putative aldouronate transport system permease protein|nr:carbohydrate ABC transporter permease [Clostridiales bacterium]
MIQRLTPSRVIFNIFNYAFMTFLAASIILPFVNSLALSFSDNASISAGTVVLWPEGFNTESYKLIFQDRLFTVTILNTIFLTVVNTLLVVFIALLAGYALQCKEFKLTKLFTFYIMIPMFFSGGMIPSYILISSWLHLSNNYLALILPAVTSPFLIIVFRNNIANMPREMIESAEIDGANDMTILIRIVIPLILPTVIAFVIFNAVGYWNEWFGCLLYIRDPAKFTMQYKLRQILSSSIIDKRVLEWLAVDVKDMIHPKNIQNAALLVTIIPIMLIYPFLQRYFIHGTIAGALKG